MMAAHFTWRIVVGFQVTRLEGQVMRYKTAAENSEKVEDELKAEKRKLQREVAAFPACHCSGWVLHKPTLSIKFASVSWKRW